MYLELFHSKDGWRVRLRGRNGRILMSSEAYSAKNKARAIAVTIHKATVLPWIERKAAVKR